MCFCFCGRRYNPATNEVTLLDTLPAAPAAEEVEVAGGRRLQVRAPPRS